MGFKDEETRRAYGRAYYAANRERINTLRSASYAATTAQRREAIYAWRKANPEMFAYIQHRGHARKRGVPFLMTFKEWWSIWNVSGKWSLRGQRKGQYVMARFGDQGPYAVGNVHIITCSENIAEGNKLRHR